MTEQSKSGTKPRRKFRRTQLSEDEALLVARVETACGLKSVRPGGKLVKGGQKAFKLDETANVVLPGDGPVPFAQAQFVAFYPEGEGGKRLRLVVLRPHFEEGRVIIGGSRTYSDRPSPDDGWAGLWQVPSGRVVFRDAIPDDYAGKEYPDGHYKDIRVLGKSALSIFSKHAQYRETNMELVALLTASLDMVERVDTPAPELEVPQAFVARGEGLLNARFMGGNGSAVLAVNKMLVDVMNSGFWVLPGLENEMTARAAGVVKDVGDSHISIEYADGSGETLQAPVEQIASYIKERIPLRTANLPVVPLVRKGENIEPGVTLWGGSAARFDSVTAMMSRTPRDVNEEQRDALLRAWAVLVTGSTHGNHTVYPMKFVAPNRSSEVYFRPGVNRVSLTKHPAKVLRVDGCGISADFYTLAHRARYWRRWRERVAREEERDKSVAK